MANVRWTHAAEEGYLSMLASTYAHSISAALFLDESVEKLIDRIRSFEFLCPPLERVEGLRRCVITPHIALVYDVSGDEITIISIFDTRADHPFN